MSIINIFFHDKIGKLSKISLSFCFLEMSEGISLGFKNEFDLAIVNESLVFVSLRFYCISKQTLEVRVRF